MLSPRRAYTLGAGSVFFSRAISTLAGVISLWLLSRILNTDAFAHYIVTMSIVVLGGYLAGLGLERSMLLRIAQLRSEHGQLLGRGMMLKIAALALVLSMLVAGGLVHYFTSMAAHDGLGMWVRWMVAIVPATAISLVLIVWFRANHLVGTAELMQGLVDGARCLILIGVFLFALGPPWVAVAAVVAAFLPLIVLTFRAWGKSENMPVAFHLADVGSGLQFLLIRLSQMGLNQFGIIAVGLWAISTEAAQFAVAARLAALAAVGQLALSSTYAPRLRAHVAEKNHVAIAREFSTARTITYLITLAAAVFFYVFGAAILQAFGNLAGGYTALLILMAGQIGFVCFGPIIEHLSMTEELRLAVYIRTACTAIFIVLLFFLVPAFADTGAALSFLIANLCLCAAGALALHRCGGLTAFSPLYAVSAVSAVIGLVVGALVAELWWLCLAVLLAAGAVIVLAERKTLVDVLSWCKPQ